MSRFGRLRRHFHSRQQLTAAHNVKGFTKLSLEQLEDRVLPSISPASLLSGLYRDLLQRDPDPTGQAHWTQALQGGNSAADVALQIVQSSEYHGKFVDQEYSALLGRPADAFGRSTFSSWLDAGATPEQVETKILASPEYLTRAGGTTSSYLDALYRDALGRKMDASGAATFGQALDAGVPRDVIASTVLTSVEGDQRQVQELYQQFLHRTAEPGGLTTWVTALQHNIRTDQVMAEILGSDEYQLLQQSSGRQPGDSITLQALSGATVSLARAHHEHPLRASQ